MGAGANSSNIVRSLRAELAALRAGTSTVTATKT